MYLDFLSDHFSNYASHFLNYISTLLNLVSSPRKEILVRDSPRVMDIVSYSWHSMVGIRVTLLRSVSIPVICVPPEIRNWSTPLRVEPESRPSIPLFPLLEFDSPDPQIPWKLWRCLNLAILRAQPILQAMYRIGERPVLSSTSAQNSFSKKNVLYQQQIYGIVRNDEIGNRVHDSSIWWIRHPAPLATPWEPSDPSFQNLEF